jgi:serine/threonine protein kinase
VKVLQSNKLKSEHDQRNLKNEIAIMAEINSPHVVRLFDSTKTKNNIYLVQELCNAGDLDSYRKLRGGNLVEQEARLILKQILMGLAAIKEKQVMHRDLKLPNILVNFSSLSPDVCVDKQFDLAGYI